MLKQEMMKGYSMIRSTLVAVTIVVTMLIFMPPSLAVKKEQIASESDGCKKCGKSDYCQYNNLSADERYCDLFSRKSLNVGIGSTIGAGLFFGPMAFVFSDINGGLFREDLRYFFNYMHVDESGSRLFAMPSDRDLNGEYEEKNMSSTKINIVRPPLEDGNLTVFNLRLNDKTKGVYYILKSRGKSYKLLNIKGNTMIVLDEQERIRCAGHYTKRGKGKHSGEANWINLYCDSEFGSQLSSSVPIKGGPYVNITYIPVVHTD